ncbi:MAG TPA: hypothetical protein VFN10_21815 [Thermoanaerobaculia bacterium]|nr:hypothetical protein [Thermoanaerobaculia bacterium]
MNKRSMAVLLGLFAVTGTLFAAPAQKQTEPANGMKAAVDANGQLRQPSSRELQQLQSQSKRHAFDKPLVMKTTASGAMSITLDERYDMAFVATTDANGRLVFACIDGPDQADAVVSASTNDTILRIRPAQTAARPAAERE